MTQQENCIFCKIVSGGVAVKKILENDKVTAFFDMSPSAPVHVLIVPKDHIATFLDLDDLALQDSMRQLAQEIIKKLEVSDGYRLVFNGGRYQHVPHLHWHLLGGDLISKGLKKGVV